MLQKTHVIAGIAAVTGLFGVGVLALSGFKDPEALLTKALSANDCYMGEEDLISFAEDHEMSMDELETLARAMAEAGTIALQSEGVYLAGSETCSNPIDYLVRYAENNDCRLADDPLDLAHFIDDLNNRYDAQAAENALSDLIVSGRMSELFQLTSGEICGP